MLSSFFIKRPVFALVISLLIVMAGILGYTGLPVAQYPDIAPPKVQLRTMYPGASAKVVEEAITSVIEREMNGVPGYMYMEASSDSSGNAVMMITFEQGTDPDIAAIEVQNRLTIVEPRLPEEVRRQGMYIEKASDSMSMIVALTSDGSMDRIELGELSASLVEPVLKRVKGVGRVERFGSEQAMRIWPDPVKMESLQITSADLVNAVRSQSARMIIGYLGGDNVPPGAPINATILGEETLGTPEEYENISLRTNRDGSAVLLRDIARVEIGADMYSFGSRVNGKDSTMMGIKLAPGANAIDTSERIIAALEELKRNFPVGVEYSIPYETSTFVQISIEKVGWTLLEAIGLVFGVMLLFMQNFRATLIPTLVVPVALLGTFAVMWATGFSINMLTMFSMVLSIGILVDDAIIVVENVERIMTEEGLSPKDATIKAMNQISGAIIGITLVLVSVFIPMAFFGGAVGNIYRQFSLTMAVSISFSAFLALTLTPALCATILKPVPEDHHEKKGFFGWFNRSVVTTTKGYSNIVKSLVRKPVLIIAALGLYALTIGGVGTMYMDLKSAFLPDEDKGSCLIAVWMPPGTPLNDTLDALKPIEKYLMEEEPVAYATALGGYNMLSGAGSNMATFFVTLKDWKERKEPHLASKEVVNRINQRFGLQPNMMIMAINPPAIFELGSTSGIDFRLENRGGLSREEFMAARDQFLALAAKNPVLTQTRDNSQADTQQLQVHVDRKKAQAMGVSMDEINKALSVMFGSDYIGDFVLNNQVRKIIVQADGKNRISLNDLNIIHVRNDAGAMVPLSAFISIEWVVNPPQYDRYNGYPAFKISAEAAPGNSTGQAMEAFESIAEQLPPEIGFDWTGQSYEEKLSGSQAILLFGLSILVVYLVLCALYESWFVPASVMMVVPLGLVGALAAMLFRELSNDIYFKVGLITTIGLSAKNAILIVEVAKDMYAQGMGLVEATVEAARLRLRPIVMTSMAFGIGVVPLALATGAGAGAQEAIGTGVLGGIITATVLAIFFVPLFYVLITRLSELLSFKKKKV